MELKLSEKVYNTLKWITMVLLPALAAFYIMVSDTWGLPNSEQVAATIASVIVFLGIFLQINSAQFKLRLAQVIESDTLARLKLKLVLSNEMYDTIKWITTIFMPAVTVLYVALADIWHLPYPTQVAGTLTALVIFLGALLQISSLEYKTSMYVLKPVGEFIRQKIAKSQGYLAMSPETYDNLKFISQVLIPGLATFYVAMARVWGWPLSEQISATAMAIVLFMNALLQVSTMKYNAAIAALKE